MEESICLKPIGVIRSPLASREEAPRQGSEADVTGTILVEERYAEALLGIEPGQEIDVICWMHLADRAALRVHPRGDVTRPVRGVFSTRSPDRPNPLSIERVEVLAVEGTRITVKGLDAVDGTPVVDIKRRL